MLTYTRTGKAIMAEGLVQTAIPHASFLYFSAVKQSRVIRAISVKILVFQRKHINNDTVLHRYYIFLS